MANSALLVMDVQQTIVDMVDGGAAILPSLRSAIDGARAAGVPVIYVAIEVRKSWAAASPRSKAIAFAVRTGIFDEGGPGLEIHPDIAPQEGDVVVTKRRGSAFSGSDLELVLRSRDIDHLALAGIATSGVVLHTACHANDRDLGLTILKDACLDLDPETHRFLVETLFPQWAEVVSVKDWIASGPVAAY
ncbi:cysteine hydrolase family protein [Nonomuraea typhae]|uniref:cysteine hydrolase family protein n=1 Tax=Nonomuraea typhae TaxID=2603600 RepID=UPI0012F7B719|nr:cysteine hydrolase [Nonomuraea typhae]